MAVFVELDDDVDEYTPFPRNPQPGNGHAEAKEPPPPVRGPIMTPMTEALGCYPIVISIAASIDLNTLDSLARTCRGARRALLQSRTILLASTLHCSNEAEPVDPEDTLRYRARAGNWFYKEELYRTGAYNGKSGMCARDLVSECRRCGTVVCRNCAIKPPAHRVLQDRHRRICLACTKAPLGQLVKPALSPSVTLKSESLKQATCRCEAEGVWLCQPCGRTMRGDDEEYRCVWRWRSQYGEVLGGLGTGIGEGDRGVPCGRGRDCCGAREVEHEMDCDAEDARSAGEFQSLSLFPDAPPGDAHATIIPTPWSLSPPAGGEASSSATPPVATPPAVGALMAEAARRTPSPGYARHEIEGIGGVVKTKLVRMVKVAACVPEWEDEMARGQILGRETSGAARSYCGWCWRVIPGRKDRERSEMANPGEESDDTASSSPSSI